MDQNKKVQEAACSAVAILIEDAGEEMTPYVDALLQTFAAAFQLYQRKSLLILYDTIGTLAENIRTVMNQPRYIELLMPPLIQKWSTIADDDRDIFPLLEVCSLSLTYPDSYFFSASPLSLLLLVPVSKHLLRLFGSDVFG